ncbi:MAG: hypothetical protein IPK30_10745 [Cellvibrionales bacterium]|nr:hypothetical protein [Cellvibrionales bacterium]
MLNDFWFLKYEFAPYDPDVDEKCQKKYMRPWRFHIIWYIFFAIVCWPIAVFTLVIECIRINKAAYYNARLYEATYYGKRFVEPSDSRLSLYVAAFIVWAVLYFMFSFMFPQYSTYGI